MAEKIVFQPMGRRVEARPDHTLLELAIKAGVGLLATCGGKGLCGKCRVLPQGETTPPGESEQKALGTELGQGVRLACQTGMPAGGTVLVPKDSQEQDQVILTQGAGDPVPLDPAISLRLAEMPPARLGQSKAQAERLAAALSPEGELAMPLSVLRELPRALPPAGGRVAAVLRRGKEVLAVAPAKAANPLGLAVDLGSTTVVAYLHDLVRGRCLAVSSAMNPQVSFGDDVISRISHCQDQPGGLERLGGLAVECVNQLAVQACQKAKANPADIMECTMVGNTAMHHIFLGLDPSGLAQAPYLPVAGRSLQYKAAELGLDFHPQAWLVWLPVMAGFVGADTVALALAARADRFDKPTLLLDLGTNGEMVLAAKGELLCCSTAAGPAFEGCHIRYGMRGAPGAVERVDMAGADLEPVCVVIGGGKAAGICGSGLVSLLARMVEKGLVLPGGGLDQQAAPRRIRQGPDGLEYLLVQDADCPGGELTVSARDISELQLAKAAVRAGVELMMAEMGVKQLDRVLMAGAFGNYLDPAAAATLGLFPPLAADRVQGIGNAAGAGAVMALLNQGARDKASSLAQKMRYLELAAHPDFNDAFVDAMLF